MTPLLLLHQTLHPRVMKAEAEMERTKILLPDSENGYHTPFVFEHISPMHSESYVFRLTKEKCEYRFTATLIGATPKDIQAVNIMGDCGSDTYDFHSHSSPSGFGNLLCSGMDYLFSKGEVRQAYSPEKAIEDIRYHIDENLKDLRARLVDAHDGTNGENSEEAKDALRKFEEQVALWEQAVVDSDEDWQQNHGNFHVDTVEILGSSFYDIFTDCRIGYEWDAMAHGRYRQLRYFGLWLIERETYNASIDVPSHG